MTDYCGAEIALLKDALDAQRDVAVWKLDGLTEEQARRPVVASGTSLLGIVKHLATVEYFWFCQTFGRDCEQLPDIDAEPDADFKIDRDETTADVVAFYRRARAAANLAIDELPLETTAMSWFEEQVSMRWVLLHMIEETARHAGHADILREILDGQVGYRHPGDT